MIVSPPFEITGRVRPAALPRADLEITEGNLIVSGTGNTETGKTTCPSHHRTLWKIRKLIKVTLIKF